MSTLSFGIFLAPYHCPAGDNPTAAYACDLDVLRLVDGLGFDEAWIGEHHSCGVELIPDPMMFIAHAANHTRHIKLGTGVVSLPYHNPLWVGRPRAVPRPPDPRPLHARHRSRCAAHRRVHDRHRARGAARGVRGGRGRARRAATRRDRYREDRPLHPGRGPLPARALQRFRDRRRRRRLADGPARGGQERVGPALARRDRAGAGSTRWPCTGTSWRSAAGGTACRRAGTGGASSGRCTSPRPASRRSRTCGTASTSGADYTQHVLAAPHFRRRARRSTSGSRGSTRPASG